ncbi:hypothetical protein GJ496_010108 [Pomphorhynchus laevis]|nr:hypothetical protein GJ496_010108 [Pomphorhynchus laevis]
MRDDLVHDCFLFMDQLYGFDKLISRNHEIFSNSIIYTADSDYLPDWDFQCHNPILTDFTWTNHKGGFEGLRQKGWTTVTVSAIKLASLKTNTKISILGQGDNQLLKIKINTTGISHKEMKDYCLNQLEIFRNELDSIFSRIGLPLKMEETWVSESTFSYGKFMIFKGSALPTSLKRASSFRPYSSENIPTLDNSISTISANGMSMFMNDLKADMALISTILETTFCFSYHLTNSLLLGKGLEATLPNVVKNLDWYDFKKHDFNSYNGKILLLRPLMTCGGILGGYPVCCPLHFIVRGFPDPLTEWLVFLKNLCDVNHSNYLLSFINNMINIDTVKPKSYLGLISEPLSLNILDNSRPEGLFKGICKNYLQNANWIKNNYFKEFIRADTTKKTELIEVLVSMKLYDARLAHEIMESTAWGYMDNVTSRVRSTSTMQVLAPKNSQRTPLKDMKNAESNCMRSTIMRIYQHKKAILNIRTECSRIIAQTLREESWKITPIVRVTTHHPLEILKLIYVGYDSCLSCKVGNNDYILCIGSKDLSDKKLNAYSIEGPHVPYIGSKTSVKIQSDVERLPTNPDPLTHKAVRLQRVIGWFVSENNPISNIISSILTSITDADPNRFRTQHSTMTGSEDHRFRDSVTKSGAYGLNPRCFIYLTPICEDPINLFILKQSFPDVYVPKFCNKQLSVSCVYIKLVFLACVEMNFKSLPDRIKNIIIPSRRKGTSDLWEICCDRFLENNTFSDQLKLVCLKSLFLILPTEEDRIIVSPSHMLNYIVNNDICSRFSFDFVETNRWMNDLEECQILNLSPDYLSKLVKINNNRLENNVHTNKEIIDIFKSLKNIILSFPSKIIDISISSEQLIDNEETNEYKMMNCLRQFPRAIWDIPHFCILDTSRILTWIDDLEQLSDVSTRDILVLGDGLGYITLYLKAMLHVENVVPFNYINEYDLSDEALSNVWNVFNTNNDDGKSKYDKLIKQISECNMDILSDPDIFISMLKGVITNAILLCDVTFNKEFNKWESWKSYMILCYKMLGSLCLEIHINLSSCSLGLIGIISYYWKSLNLITTCRRCNIGSIVNNDLIIKFNNKSDLEPLNHVDLEDRFITASKKYGLVQYTTIGDSTKRMTPATKSSLDSQELIDIIKGVAESIEYLRPKFLSLIKLHNPYFIKDLITTRNSTNSLISMLRYSVKHITSKNCLEYKIKKEKDVKKFLISLGRRSLIGFLFSDTMIKYIYTNMVINDIKNTIYQDDIEFITNYITQSIYLKLGDDATLFNDNMVFRFKLSDFIGSRGVASLK